MDYFKRFFTHRDQTEDPLPQAHHHQQQQQPHNSPTAARPSAPPREPHPAPQRSHSRHRHRHTSPTSAWPPAPPPSPRQDPKQSLSRHRHHRSKRKRNPLPTNMPAESFTGPSCRNLVEFMKSVKDIPSKHKNSFDEISKKSIETICDAEALHVWESGDDVDDLLQLAQVIVKLKKIAADAGQEKKNLKDVRMIIIAEEKKGRNGLERICDLVRHLTKSDEKKHLNGTVYAFNAIVVVRGIDYAGTSDANATIKRINTAIERVFKMTRRSPKQIIWHHGPILSLLLTWINTTSSDLRSSLAGISITATLDLADGVKPSPIGRANKLPDLQRLEDYAKKLDIPVIFVDPGSQLITYEYLASYMYFWAYYIHTFLPPSVIRPHYHKALDDLVTFAFRLRGASESEYGLDVVRTVQDHLNASNARRWARNCINPASYTKDLCRTAGKETAIHQAVQLADAPFALFAQVPGYPLPAFSRLPLSPSTDFTTISESYIAAPVSFSFTSCSFRATSSTTFRILLPREGQDVEKVTARIQGTMMGVLQRIILDRGKPVLAEGDKEVWKEVVKACEWAIVGCKGKMPEGVEEKVNWVKEKLTGGLWGIVNGVKKGAQQGGQQGWQTGGAAAYGALGGQSWQGGQMGGAKVGASWN